jgi:phosphorylcholine metabolism protein LicD
MFEKYFNRFYRPLHNFKYSRLIRNQRAKKAQTLNLDLVIPDKRLDHNDPPKQVKAIGLRILNLLSYLSECYNFDFTLAYGTLLGAKRHKGFIPWDDDIDVFMSRKDFISFIDVIYQLPSHLLFVPMDVDFFKIMDRSSIVSMDGKRGVAVDIFILDDKQENKLSFLNVHTLRRLYIDRKEFYPLRKTPFEEFEFTIPANAHSILVELYGDYMKLPPVENRVSHHSNPNNIKIASYGQYLVVEDDIGN